MTDHDQFERLHGNPRLQNRILWNSLGGHHPKDSSIDRSGAHGAPTTSDSPLHDLALNGAYPEDFYEGKHHQYVGTTEEAEGANAAISLAGKPNSTVKIYRSVEHDHPTGKISPGDWVTTSKKYADEHGKANISGGHKILSKTVTAGELFTDGNSLAEFGYHPQKKKVPSVGIGLRKTLEKHVEFHKNNSDSYEFGSNLNESDDAHRRDLGKVAIVDRVRGGKIQIRKLVNEVAGYKIVDSTLQKMTPEEIRARKRGARVAVRKRRGESAKIDRHLHLSLDKREQRLS